MAQKVSTFKVGVFVLLGLFMALGAIVWLGAMQYLQSGKDYVTFFDESVQGLQKDSLVKYRGVDVGRVEQIRVAPDYRLIEVVMQIDFEGEPATEMVAQLKTVGITGIVFVELDLKKPGEPDLSPEITFAAEYPIIPSRPSELTQILGTISKVAEEITQIDFKGMAEKLDGILGGAEKIVKDARLGHAMEDLKKASANLARLTAKGDKMLDQLQVGKLRKEAGEVLKNAALAMAEAKSLLEEVKREIVKADLPGVSQDARQVVDTLGGQGEEVMEEVQATTENLRRTSETLENLVRRLENNPSDIIFSKPPPPREGGEE